MTFNDTLLEWLQGHKSWHHWGFKLQLNVEIFMLM